MTICLMGKIECCVGFFPPLWCDDYKDKIDFPILFAKCDLTSNVF